MQNPSGIQYFINLHFETADYVSSSMLPEFVISLHVLPLIVKYPKFVFVKRESVIVGLVWTAFLNFLASIVDLRICLLRYTTSPWNLSIYYSHLWKTFAAFAFQGQNILNTKLTYPRTCRLCKIAVKAIDVKISNPRLRSGNFFIKFRLRALWCGMTIKRPLYSHVWWDVVHSLNCLHGHKVITVKA